MPKSDFLNGFSAHHYDGSPVPGFDAFYSALKALKAVRLAGEVRELNIAYDFGTDPHALAWTMWVWGPGVPHPIYHEEA
ncbi:MAG: hypothetical protein ACETWR_05275 [Anaerolineae bacterium]